MSNVPRPRTAPATTAPCDFCRCDASAAYLVPDYFDAPPRGRSYADAYACAGCAARLSAEGWEVLDLDG